MPVEMWFMRALPQASSRQISISRKPLGAGFEHVEALFSRLGQTHNDAVGQTQIDDGDVAVQEGAVESLITSQAVKIALVI